MGLDPGANLPPPRRAQDLMPAATASSLQQQGLDPNDYLGAYRNDVPDLHTWQEVTQLPEFRQVLKDDGQVGATNWLRDHYALHGEWVSDDKGEIVTRRNWLERNLYWVAPAAIMGGIGVAELAGAGAAAPAAPTTGGIGTGATTSAPTVGATTGLTGTEPFLSTAAFNAPAAGAIVPAAAAPVAATAPAEAAPAATAPTAAAPTSTAPIVEQGPNLATQGTDLASHATTPLSSTSLPTVTQGAMTPATVPGAAGPSAWSNIIGNPVSRIIDTAVPAITNYFGNKAQADAQKDAAEKTAEAAREALAWQKQVFGVRQDQLAPWVNTGGQAAYAIADMLHLPRSAPSPPSQQPTTPQVPGTTPSNPGPTAGQPTTPTTPNTPAGPQMVAMVAPDGRQLQVPLDKVDYALQHGAKKV